MDVCKIKPTVYQYTAIDDCSRYKVLGLYDRATAANTLDFLERVIEEMPFPIQRIQTDRGREFFAEVVQQRLMDWAMKFRPIPPGPLISAAKWNGPIALIGRSSGTSSIRKIRRSKRSCPSGSITGIGIDRTRH
jgi:hypothetical protein